VIDVLKAAFVQGRLAKEEFDLRVGQVLASRTYADLDALTADIPAGLASAPPPMPAPAQGHAPVAAKVAARERAIMAAAMFGGLASVIALFAYPVAPLLFLVGIGSIFISLLLLRTPPRGRRPR
jgi:hypothetical protein